MSFRERVERLTDTHYVLPRTGAMRVDVHAFLSPIGATFSPLKTTGLPNGTGRGA